MRLALCLGMAMMAARGAAQEPQKEWAGWVPASHPQLKWTGRAAFDAQGTARFDWSGVSCEARFKGAAVTVYLEPQDNDIAILIDGRLHAIAGTEPRSKDHPALKLWVKPQRSSPRTYVFKGFSAGQHTLLIYKRTGPNFGPAKLQGLRFDKGAALLPPSPRALRRLEFVGDSLTNAYGNEGPDRNCVELRPYENSLRSYATLAAAALGAEAQLLAYSGYGVVRNYGSPERSSKDPYPLYYPRTVLAEPEVWDRAKFKPDLAVLFLGTNDHSTEPIPKADEFAKGYRELLASLQKDRPGMPVLCIYPVDRQVLAGRVQALVKEARAAGKKVEVLGLSQPAENELGCDWHPKAVVHERWAKLVEAKIRDTMKW